MIGEHLVAGGVPVAEPAPAAGPGSPPTVSLRGVAYRHGAWQQIETLAEAGGVPEKTVEDLRRGGLRQFSVLEGSLREQYVDCVAETLEKTGVDPAEVDAVVYFSTSFTYAEQDDIALLCRSLGMRNALPFGTLLGECTNFTSAILVATSLIGALGMRTVVLLGADALGGESPERRLLDRNVSVFSDAVVSCVLQAGEADDGYVIEKLAQRFDADLVGLDTEQDLVRLLDLFARAMGHVCEEVYASTGRGPKEFDHLVLPNLGVSALRNYAAVARVPWARVQTENIGRFGHCFAYDQLIALDTLAAGGAVAHGDSLLVIGVGANYLFSATALRRCSSGGSASGGSR